MAIDTQYDIVWTSQSLHSGQSMPVGGYDTGLNVWVEQGQLLFYIDRSGCLDENNQMLKPGRIRIAFTPNPLAVQAEFTQTLRLRDGRIEVRGKLADCEMTLTVWLETHRPVIHVDARSSEPLRMTAAYESWRLAPRELSAAARMAAVSWYAYPGSVVTRADEVELAGNRIVFAHRNAAEALLFDRLVEQQGLQAIGDRLWNPQRGLIFGGCMFGEGMVAEAPTDLQTGAEFATQAGAAAGAQTEYAGIPFRAWRLVSEQPTCEFRLYVCLHAEYCEEPEQWREQLEALSVQAAAESGASERLALQWWHAYWERSHIVLQANGERDELWEIGRNYQLFRYMLGCNACGSAPTKFNGGLFTSDPGHVDAAVATVGPDYRRWGGGSVVAQNQRLVYWPMLKSGDAEMMRPQFELYRRALGNAEARTAFYWGHEGCSFTEQVENFGLPIGWGWGWENTEDRSHTRPRFFDPTELIGPWIRYQYTGQLEMAYMMLESYRYTGNDIAACLPFIESAIRFYDAHYQWRHEVNTTRRLDAQGRLVIFPSTAAETYKDAANPTDVIAGLHAVAEALLSLPEHLLDAQRRTYYEELITRIPPLAYRDCAGKRTIAPAHFWTDIINCELPQLYPVFPYDRIGLGDESLQTAIDTWHYGIDNPDQKNHISWHQDGIFCARLGLTEEAAEQVRLKLGSGETRFPAFWGPGHDWLPDHNWGGSGMITLQEMLLQCRGRRLLLFPAWPRAWDVGFKLHAPYGTVVEGELKAGRLVALRVEPETRMADVVNMLEGRQLRER